MQISLIDGGSFPSRKAKDSSVTPPQGETETILAASESLLYCRHVRLQNQNLE